MSVMSGNAEPVLDDGEAATGGAIATSGSLQPGYRVSRRLICLSDPEGAATDSIRSLRSHLMAGHVRDGRRALAVCAPTSGAGSTFVAANLATAFAQAGVNTLLIDANLHTPGVDAYIRPDVPADGLRQMLSARADGRIDEVRRDVLPNLSVLYAGGPGRASSELIANRRFKELIDDCMRDFEFTIVDTPTEGGTADMRRVAMSVRSALIVARRNLSYQSQIKELATQLSADRIRLIGTFLTDF
jgi:protein-tyrosine kinase